MNHIKALMLAESINQERLEAARRRQYARPAKPRREARQSHLGAMVRAYLLGFRAKPQPSR